MSAETRLLQAFAAQHPDELSRLIERLAPIAFAEVLEALATEQAAAIAARVVPSAAARALTELRQEAAAQIILQMQARSAASVLLRMSPAERERLYRALPDKHASALGAAVEYGTDRAGGRIDPNVPMLLETSPVEAVLDQIARHAA